MNLLLTFLVLALAGALFYTPSVEPYRQPFQWAVLILLGVSVILQLVRRPGKGEPRTSAGEPPRTLEPVSPSVEVAVEAGVVQFLSRLQEKGRLVDFAMDDITPYSNEQVGAAARVVHQGCREVLQEAFDLRPVHGGEERETVSLSGEYDAGVYRLVGKVPEHPPYQGVVLHRGWKTTRVALPRVADAALKASAREIVAPAEVEIE
jgi:hypothetical protein